MASFLLPLLGAGVGAATGNPWLGAAIGGGVGLAGSTAGTLGTGAAASAASAGGIGSLFGGTGLAGLGLLAAAAGPYLNRGKRLDGSEKPKEPKLEKVNYDYEYVDPEEDYEPGYDPEHMYFRRREPRNYAYGGLVTPTNLSSPPGVMGRMQPGQVMPPQALPPAGINSLSTPFSRFQSSPNMGPNWQNFTNNWQASPQNQRPVQFAQAPAAPAPVQNMKAGGLVKGYAQGGIAEIPMKKGAAGNDQELIEEAAMALMGQHENAEAVLQNFVKEFGQQALQDLAERVQLIMAKQGGGDGLSDSVPANLSEGEYVVPADVVSNLGNGSTDAGGKQLDGMVDRTRQLRGTPAVPPPLKPEKVMPV